MYFIAVIKYSYICNSITLVYKRKKKKRKMPPVYAINLNVQVKKVKHWNDLWNYFICQDTEWKYFNIQIILKTTLTDIIQCIFLISFVYVFSFRVMYKICFFAYRKSKKNVIFLCMIYIFISSYMVSYFNGINFIEWEMEVLSCIVVIQMKCYIFSNFVLTFFLYLFTLGFITFLKME